MTLLGRYQRINYGELPPPYQEKYNFQKASAILAEFGFATMLLPYEWKGADFIAMHINGDFLKIQLKGRIHTNSRYLEQNIFIMFQDRLHKIWYLYPHDELWTHTQNHKPGTNYAENGINHANPTRWMRNWLNDYAINSENE